MALAQTLTLDRQQARSLPAALNTQAEMRGWPYRCDPSQTFDRPELTALGELWHTKNDDGLPTRASLDMRTLKPFVRNIFLMDRIGQKGVWRYRFRLFGSNLVHLFGEHTGRYLDEMVSPALLQNWLACFDTTIRYGGPLRFINYYRTQTNGFLKGEFFAAPLAEEAPDQPLVLAATFVDHNDAAHSPLD
jgi:PAS domain